MKKQKVPRRKQANIRFAFSDGSAMTQRYVDFVADRILYYAKLAMSDSPDLRMQGKEWIRKIAEVCVDGEFFLADQIPKARKPRGTIETDEGRTSSTAIIKELADERDALGDYLKPANLWPRYVAALDELNLSPTEDKLGVTFDGGRTTKNSFRAMLSRQRNRKS